MPDRYMLDTDVSSYVIRENPRTLLDVFVAHREAICISSITYAELLYGLRNRYSERLERKIDQFVSLVRVMDWTACEARKYAELRHHLQRSGTPIGNMDMLIAASALSVGAALVTNNKKHFSCVPNLEIADWL